MSRINAEEKGESKFDDLRAAIGAIEKDANTDFEEFTNHLSRGKFRLPHRKTMTDRIARMADDLVENTKKILSAMGASVAPWLATDCWTSAGKSY